jgi:hypothetical protein
MSPLLNATQRGYLMASVPGAGGAAGEFYITETDARTATVGFTNRLRIDAAGTTFVQGGAVGQSVRRAPEERTSRRFRVRSTPCWRCAATPSNTATRPPR